MNAIIISFALLVAVPLLSLAVARSDYDDRDRRGWFPHARPH
ncbi:MAG TPA: hypothetical protein VKA45_12780 [Gaiellaceae bacterium]|nr:hypothetical protein [Gaiellaceae bacterium]